MRKVAASQSVPRAHTLQFIAIVVVAIYLIPEGAHLFEMPNKLRLTPDSYMTVQQIYDGWAFFGVIIVLAVGCTLGCAIAMRRNLLAQRLSLGSCASLVGTQIIFWSFIYPMNALTRNWSEMPNHFEAARRQWEYAHAGSAGLVLLAFVLALWGLVISTRPTPSAIETSSIASEESSHHLPSLTLAVTALLSTGAFIGLAILGWGGPYPFFSHAPLAVLTAVTGLLTIAALFTAGNLNPGIREDRANRWVLAAFAILGLLIGWLPALTDRLDWGTIDGETTRWIGVALFTIGGTIRLWPVFVLGNRFSGLVAIQQEHQLLTTGPYRHLRHPSYLGLLISVFGWALAFRSIAGVVLALATIIPVIARIRAEEALLVDVFGDDYRAYRAGTARLLPGLY
jgi:protein-S-isoprenylcysteine O-methyltransferase Ste14